MIDLSTDQIVFWTVVAARILIPLVVFRFPLPAVLKRRMANPQGEAKDGVLITDDFAPVNLYDAGGRKIPRR